LCPFPVVVENRKVVEKLDAMDDQHVLEAPQSEK
jgi:hypothetical protein